MKYLSCFALTFAVAIGANFLSLTAGSEVVVHRVVIEKNGISEIPDGLLGVHATPYPEKRVEDWGITQVRKIHWGASSPTKIEGVKKVKNKKGKWKSRGFPEQLKYVVDCFYDRYQAALPVSNPKDWQKKLEDLAEQYAKGANRSKQDHFLEFWNEPYLNWGTKPGVNYVEDFYENRGIKKGDPMVLKGQKEPVEGLEWDKEIFVALNPNTKQPVWHMSAKIPSEAKEGETVNLHGGAGKAKMVVGEKINIYGQPHIVGRRWVGKDVDQKFYWAGPVNVKWYTEMLSYFGPLLKKKAPQVMLAGGWGFNMFNENWASWNRLYVPLIDTCHEWLDAIHEHHYGGDTKFVGMSYEVAWAYTQSRYQKRLRFWNTEAGGAVDPEQPGNYQPTPNNFSNALQKDRASMTYTLRDISFLMTYSPDKAQFRAAHEAHHQKGDAMAFRILKPIRGSLLKVDNPKPNIWVSASSKADGMGVLVFNDRRVDATVSIKVPKMKQWTLRRVKEVEGELVLREEKLNGDEILKIQVPKKAGVSLEGEGRLGNLEKEVWTQFASKDVLVSLKNAEPLTISLGKKSAKTDYQLRLVVERSHANLKVKVGSQEFEFKGVSAGINDIDLGSLELGEEVQLEISSDNEKPGRLLACSLWQKQ